MAQYLTFDLSEERYAVDVGGVEVVLESAPITWVPNSPPTVRGVINHRGSVIPVIDLRLAFGVPETVPAERCSVIVANVDLDGDALVVGILADSVHEVMNLESTDIEAPPPLGVGIDAAFLMGIGKSQDRFILLLNLDRAILHSLEAELPALGA